MFLHRIRNQKGLSGLWVIILLLIPASVGIGAFAVDMMHLGTVKGALQKACDSAALAGAAEIQNADNPAGLARVDQMARAVAKLNFVEGQPVQTDATTYTTVAVDPTVPNFPGGEWGRVRVTSTKRVRNLFAQVFGRPYETLNCSAVAGPTYNLNTISAGRWFPLAVSWDQVNQDGKALKDMNLNDAFNLDGDKKGSYYVRNAWPIKRESPGSGSGKMKYKGSNFIKRTYLDPNQTAPLKRGDDVWISKQTETWNAFLNDPAVQTALNSGQILYMPVIKGPPKTGSGKNQGSSGSGGGGAKPTVVGFVAFKPDSLTFNGSGGSGRKSWKISGKIVKGENFGRIDPAVPPILSSGDQSKMDSLGILAIRLLE